MASSLKMTISVAAAVLLLATTQQTQTLAAEAATDMVPVSPAESMLVAMPGGGAGTLAAPLCLQCRCCSKSNPSKCEITSCCSTFNCDRAGRCNLVQNQCGCSGC